MGGPWRLVRWHDSGGPVVVRCWQHMEQRRASKKELEGEREKEIEGCMKSRIFEGVGGDCGELK